MSATLWFFSPSLCTSHLPPPVVQEPGLETSDIPCGMEAAGAWGLALVHGPDLLLLCDLS